MWRRGWRMWTQRPPMGIKGGIMDKSPKIIHLMHPELPDTPAEATQLDYWLEKGRAKGLRLRFADRDRCLTYGEIRRLQQAWQRQQAALADVPA